MRLAAERAKPDAERDPDYMNRELPALTTRWSASRKASTAPPMKPCSRSGSTAPGSSAPANASPPSTALNPNVAALYAGTKVTDPVERVKMFEETPAQFARAKIPCSISPSPWSPNCARGRPTQTHEGAVARLRPLWRRAVIAHAGKPVAPDANSTLRVSFAHVKG